MSWRLCATHPSFLHDSASADNLDHTVVLLFRSRIALLRRFFRLCSAHRARFSDHTLKPRSASSNTGDTEDAIRIDVLSVGYG